MKINNHENMKTNIFMKKILSPWDLVEKHIFFLHSTDNEQEETET